MASATVALRSAWSALRATWISSSMVWALPCPANTVMPAARRRMDEFRVSFIIRVLSSLLVVVSGWRIQKWNVNPNCAPWLSMSYSNRLAPLPVS